MTTAMKIQTIELSKVSPDPSQPRKNFVGIPELAASIKKQGLNNPIHVRKTDDGYVVVNGERRYRACLEAGIEKIPTIVMSGKESGEIFLNQILDNAAREDLSTMEEADAFLLAQNLHRIPVEEIATASSRSEKYVRESIAIGGITEKLRPLIENGSIPKSLAVRIAQEIPAEKQAKAWEVISKKAGSVKALGKRLDLYKSVLNQGEIPDTPGMDKPGENSPEKKKAEKAMLSHITSFSAQLEKDLAEVSMSSAVKNHKKDRKKLTDAAASIKARIKELEEALLQLETI